MRANRASSFCDAPSSGARASWSGPLATGVFMIALLGLGLLISAHQFVLERPTDLSQDLRSRSLLKGEITETLGDIYTRNIPFRDFAIEFWGSINYWLFREGRKGVLVGDDGWLFSIEEFDTPPGYQAEFERKLAFIGRVRDRLARQDVQLVVALIPTKASIYAEQLGRHALPPVNMERYGQALSRLRAGGVTAPDLSEPLRRGKEQAPTFLRTDTHWTNHGSRTVAKRLASVLSTASLTELEHEPSELAPVAHEGDLLRFVRLISWFDWLRPAPDALRQLVAEPREAGGDLFADNAISVALVGTSYSANDQWGFEAALKLELRADVLNVAEEGLGPLEPMHRYLSSTAFGQTPPVVVIWEIPERFLGTPYAEEIYRLPPPP